MAPRTVLITGCSSGIGLALAVKLAQDEQQRFKVIATMRNLAKREALERAAGDALNRTLEVKELDVRSEDSIRDCVNSIPERRIDILINNAGVGLIGPIECQSIEYMQGVFETNFYGVVRMIKEVLPDMKRRRSGHILVMSSVMGLQVNNAGVGLIGPIECQSIEYMQGVFETNFYGVVRMIKEVLPDMKRRRSGHILVMSSVMGLQVNNAGVGLIGPIECQSIEYMQGVFETNFYGVVRMIKEVLPDMKRRRSGHILVMSSVMGLQGIVFNDIYAASKFAIEGFCESLVFQTLMFNVHITMIEPGPVVTEFELKVYEDAKRGDYSMADSETSDLFTSYYLKNSKAIFSSLGQTPDDIAEHTLRVLTMETPSFRHQTNQVYTPLTALKYADPTGELVNDIFYKIVFQHDTLMQASLRAIKLIRWKAQKVQQGARILGFL